MRPSDLPSPLVLRRRHEALIAVEDLVGGSGDRYRHFGRDGEDVLWFGNGSGDEYRLAFSGDDALLTVFDHESPRSPWIHEDDALEWPGMFDGLPPHLRALLPVPEDDEPMSVSTCFWFVDGAWREGNPEPVPEEEGEEDEYTGDPGGAAQLLASLLDPETEVRELVGFVYEEPERVDEALELFRRLEQG